MTPLDWTVVGILGFFFLRGLYRGLNKQVAGLIRIVLGFTVATPLSYVLAPYLKDHVFLAWGVAYLIIWVGSMVVAFIYWESIDDEEELLVADRVVGGFVGILKGYVIILALSFIVVSNSEWVREKVLATPSGKMLARSVEALHFILPPAAHEKIDKYLHHLEEPEQEPEGAAEPEPASGADADQASEPGGDAGSELDDGSQPEPPTGD